MGPNRSAPPLPDVVTRTRHPIKRIAHALLSLGGWALFLWYWTTVFLAPIDRAAIQTFVALFVALVGIVTAHLLWVRFNLDIFRARGQRTRIREVTFAGTTDRLGRELDGADWTSLQTTRHIAISVVGTPERKVYTAGSFGA